MTMTADLEPRSIEDREDRIAEIDPRLAELDEEYANTRMPDDVREEWNALNAERDEHASTVAELKRRRERLRKIASNPGAVERAQPPETMPALVRRRGEEIYDIRALRSHSASDEDFRANLHDNARRAIERVRLSTKICERAGGKQRIQDHLESLLETVDDDRGTLARRMLETGSPMYERAFGKAVLAGTTAVLNADEQRAMSLGTDGEGGFAVPFQLDPSVILSSDGSINPLRTIARVVQVTGKEWQGITSAGITVTRKGEAATATDDSFTVAQPTVKPTRVDGFVPFSVEIDQDWAALRSEIATLMQDAKDEEEAESFITGDGTGDNPSGVVATLDAGSNVATATTDTVASADIYELENQLGDRWLQRARFLGRKSTFNEVRQLDTTGGSDLWVRLGVGQPPELIGYPAHRATHVPARTGTNKFLLFGDFTQFLIVDRIGMSVELIPVLVQQVTAGAGPARPTGQRGIFAFWRNNSTILVDNAFRVLVNNTV